MPRKVLKKSQKGLRRSRFLHAPVGAARSAVVGEPAWDAVYVPITAGRGACFYERKAVFKRE